MIKHLLTTAAAAVLMSGVALAQTIVVPAGTPGGDTTIKAGVAPDGSIRASATTKSLDANGQVIKDQHVYQSGPDGTTLGHTQTQTDLTTGDSTTSTTTQTTR